MKADPATNQVSATAPWAWGVCWLMFASTVLNYADRQSMAIVKPQIQKEYLIGEVEFAWVIAVFYLSYALCQLPAGYFADRWDVRLTYAGAVAWWSLAGIVAAFAPGIGALMVMRAVLGVGESFNWPCALRATSLVMKPADRSLGNGIFNSGAAIGAVLTPLIVTPLAAKFGWRTAFVVTGSLGFLWVGVWLTVLRGERGRLLKVVAKPSTRPESLDELPEHSTISRNALYAFVSVAVVSVFIALGAFRYGLNALWLAIALLMFGVLIVARVVPEKELQGASWSESLGAIVRLRRFWVLVVVSISINICWHFLANWLPTYLRDDRKMAFLAGGLWSAVPFIAADFGNLGGGQIARWLAGRGHEPARARMIVMGVCTLLISTGAWVSRAPNDTVVVFLLCVMAHRDGRFHGELFCLHAGGLSPSHRSHRRDSRRARKPLRGRFHAVCSRGQSRDGQLRDRLYDGWAHPLPWDQHALRELGQIVVSVRPNKGLDETATIWQPHRIRRGIASDLASFAETPRPETVGNDSVSKEGVTMKKPWIALGLTLAFGLPTLSGCETLSQSIRKNSGDKPKSADDDDSEEVGKVSSQAPKGFWSGSANRLSGAMSSEGRDVEHSLGIN